MKKIIPILCLLLTACTSTLPLKDFGFFTMNVTSDLHYQVDNLEKQTAIIPQMLYNHEIVDAFFKQDGDVILLGGDNTNNGRIQEHQVIIDYLKQAQREGVQTIVVPGNHDLNEISKSEYKQLYDEVIYERALSVDTASLSYVHSINSTTRVIVLDTNSSDSNQGVLTTSTMNWLESELREASQQGINVLVAAHHNLVVNSLDKYTKTYLIENQALNPLLKKYRVSLFLSGHRHTQQVSKKDDLYEIVSSTPIDYPNGFTRLVFDQKTMNYQFTQLENIETELTDFIQYSLECIKQKALDFGTNNFEKVALKDKDKTNLVELYQKVMMAYYEGSLNSIQESVKQSVEYKQWQDVASQTTFGAWLEYLIEKEARYDASFTIYK